MKFENTEVFNIKNALHGMRNPLESYSKSDSHYCMWVNQDDCDQCGEICHGEHERDFYVIGDNDLKLAQRLISAGTEHRKFLRQIFVSVDITAPLYWYKELDTYKIGTTANSTSTMHKLASTPITIDCFETDNFDAEWFDSTGVQPACDTWIISNIIYFCEYLRQQYLETKDIRYWRELIRWLPESWLQTRTITMNYENLRNMYFQRQNHKLTEWHQFCYWVESLPYSKQLITYKGDNE